MMDAQDQRQRRHRRPFSEETEAKVGMASFLSRSLGGRLALGLSDSAVSSAGNLGVSIVAARSATLAEFGVFATAMLVLILAAMLSRSAHGEPLILWSAEIDPAVVTTDRNSSTASVIWLSTGLGGVTAAVGLLLGLFGHAGFHSVVLTVIVSGTALPLLCVQEHLRWIEYARGTSHRALVNNSLWTVFSFGALVVAGMFASGGIPAYVCLMIWAYSTVPGIVYGVVAGRIPVVMRGGGDWLRRRRALLAPLVMDLTLTQATAQGATLVVAALSSAVDMAYIRKGQIWLGPTTVATMGLLSALQPILAQCAAARGSAHAVRLAKVAGVLAGAAALVYGLVVVFLPTELAELIVGAGWPESRSFVWPMTVLAAANIVGGCMGLALRSSGLIARQVAWRMVLAPASILVVAAMTYLAGALAGIWALAAVAVVTALAWSRLLTAVPGRKPREHVSAAL
jgi:hypothetical protein